MRFLCAIVLIAFSLNGACGATIVSNVADIAQMLRNKMPPKDEFDIECTALVTTISQKNSILYVADGPDAAALFLARSMTNGTILAGDRIHARGKIKQGDHNEIHAHCHSVEILGHGPKPQPVSVSGSDLSSGRYDYRLVKIQGTLRDAFDDEIDDHFTYLALNCGGKLIYAPSPRFKLKDDMIGAKIEIEGVCAPPMIGGRRYMGRRIGVMDTNAIRVVKAAVKDVFDVPEIDETQYLGPMEIQALGKRRARGTVLAAWRPNNIMIAPAHGRPIRATIASQTLPASGSAIEVVGVPETDLFSITLTRAMWRPSGETPAPPQKVSDIGFDRLFGKRGEQRRIRPYTNGKAIRIKGEVVGIDLADGHVSEIAISESGRILMVDASAVPGAADDVTVGCRIEVAGVCVLETSNWRPSALFPPASGHRIVVRKPDELRILAHPPWWTPGRLLVVIEILAAALALLLLRLALKRRFHAIIERTIVDARVGERTRLAVELHDSIAQNLTGVAMEIRSAKRAKTADPPGMDRHLDLAAATLDSCRSELRNCIWDLRSLTLDEATIDEAIRRTLQQHLASARLEVRFNAPRRLFTDNTLYTILRIIRELAINAVRHGHANDIKVAGCIDGGRLRFSVRDNGCGFNPDRAPGMSEGHFGLQGIRERIETLEGTIEIESAAGRGTKCSLSIPMSPDDH